jgi:prolyl-tRNA synthetase
MKEFISSYKDLPLYIYQIQDKFRDELRVKSGLLRGVEFVMKDLYSFHRDKKDLDSYYEKVKKAYFRIFERCGFKKETYLALASGGTFSKYSHEFQTITLYGEDEIYLCSNCKLAINKEIIQQENHRCSKCKNKKLEIKKSIEVGNIFKLGDRFSKAFNLSFRDKDGKERFVQMGCYGIGLGRVMGAIVEVNNDKNGIIWPREVAPFQVHLIQVGENQKIKKITEDIYQNLQKAGIEVLYDDREGKTPGEKFVEADLIGTPIRLVVSEKTLSKNSIEIKKRSEKELRLIKIEKLTPFLKSEC